MLLHIVARGRIGRSPEAELVDRYIKRIGWPTRVTELPDTGGKVPPLEDVVARIDAVTRDQLRSYAEGMATRAPMALALYGPVEGAPDHAQLSQARAA